MLVIEKWTKNSQNNHWLNQQNPRRILTCVCVFVSNVLFAFCMKYSMDGMCRCRCQSHFRFSLNRRKKTWFFSLFFVCSAVGRHLSSNMCTHRAYFSNKKRKKTKIENTTDTLDRTMKPPNICFNDHYANKLFRIWRRTPGNTSFWFSLLSNTFNHWKKRRWMERKKRNA